MSCKHKSKLYTFAVVYGPTNTTLNAVSFGTAGTTLPGQLRCEVCHEVIPLGHSDEHASERIEIEIRLAELLAETECFWEPCGAKDEQFDLYVDIFATDEPPQQLRRPGPRSPIEMMVDAACGYTHPESDQ